MEETRSLWIDQPSFWRSPRPDDFVVAVSAIKSGAVYLVESIRPVARKKPTPRVTRYAMRVFRVDLHTLLRREEDQAIHTLRWNPRTRRDERRDED